MVDSVTVTQTVGAPYTWAQAGFTWSSASAGKSWSGAYPAVHALAVAVSLALVDAQGRQTRKPFSEALGFAEQRRAQSVLRRSENLSFSETYSDLIACVLRWVESIGFTEASARHGQKALRESFQASDALARLLTKDARESLYLAEGLARQGTKRVAESLPMMESTRRATGKAHTETLVFADDLDRAMVKRLAEDIGFAETYADLIAFTLSISESLGMSDLAAKQVKKPVAETLVLGDQIFRQAIKRVSEAVAIGEALGRTVAYRRSFNEGLAVTDALRRAMRISVPEALDLAEQYRRHANGVVSDMIVSNVAITEADFLNIMEAGHPPGYTDFRDFIQGDYTYRRALFRAILNSRNSDRGFIENLRVTVDVPDIFDRGTAQITDAVAGASTTFTRTFRVPPEVTMTHKGGTLVAIARIVGSVTTTGFTAVLEASSGTRVSGSFTWIAQGY